MNNTPKLCGGTFFTLMLKSISIDKVSRNLYKTDDKFTEHRVFNDLIRISRPSYEIENDKSCKVDVSKYKACQINVSKYTPFDDAFTKEFDYLIRNHYSDALERMIRFTYEYLDDYDFLNQLLIASLLDLIQQDTSIPDNAEFFVKESGRPIFKYELCQLRMFTFQPFILGVWHYILANKIDNTLGVDTYNSWLCNNNAKSNLQINLGFNLFSTIEVNKTKERYYSKEASKEKYYRQIDYHDFDAAQYQDYIEGIKHKYSKMKTLLYSDYDRDFYSFYICNDLKSSFSSISSVDESGECTDYISPKNIRDCSGNRTLIVGTGGLGKSMMMRHLLLYSADQYEISRQLPILIQLKNYSLDKDLFTLILDTVNSFKIEKISKEQLIETFIDGDSILLLDGLDEIKSDLLNRFERDIEDFSDKFSSTTIFMSSRPFKSFISYVGFSTVLLQPFTLNKSLKLVKKLEFRPDEPDIKKRFYNAVRNELYLTHQDFIENPLLLTIMLLTFEQYAEVPAKRYMFYKEAFDTLAQKHDATKGAYQRIFKTGLSAFQLSDYIAAFCAKTYIDEKYEFTRLEICDTFSDLMIVKNSVAMDFTVEDFIYDLVNNVCLLYEEGDSFHFTHRSFQEYFCAVHFSKKKDKDLYRVGKMFENKQKSTQSDDQAFSMLYAMIPDKVEEYVFLPYLNSVFENAEDTRSYLSKVDNPIVQDNLSYLSWLKAQHGYIYSSNGEFVEIKSTIPHSFIYRAILNRLNIPIEQFFQNLTENKRFIVESLDTLYRIDLKVLIEDMLTGSCHQYDDILMKLTDNDFQYLSEYNAIKSYYNHLVKDSTSFSPDYDDLF